MCTHTVIVPIVPFASRPGPLPSTTSWPVLLLRVKMEDKWLGCTVGWGWGGGGGGGGSVCVVKECGRMCGGGVCVVVEGGVMEVQ